MSSNVEGCWVLKELILIKDVFQLRRKLELPLKVVEIVKGVDLD